MSGLACSWIPTPSFRWRGHQLSIVLISSITFTCSCFSSSPPVAGHFPHNPEASVAAFVEPLAQTPYAGALSGFMRRSTLDEYAAVGASEENLAEASLSELVEGDDGPHTSPAPQESLAYLPYGGFVQPVKSTPAPLSARARPLQQAQARNMAGPLTGAAPTALPLQVQEMTQMPAIQPLPEVVPASKFMREPSAQAPQIDIQERNQPPDAVIVPAANTTPTPQQIVARHSDANGVSDEQRAIGDSEDQKAAGRRIAVYPRPAGDNVSDKEKAVAEKVHTTSTTVTYTTTLHAQVDCVWADWSKWGVCTQTCSGGIQNRSRQFAVHAAHGGKACQNHSVEEFPCNMSPCNVDCEWDSWGSWANCSRTCGGGVTYRIREYAEPVKGKGAVCEGDLNQEEACNMWGCPRACEWGAWHDWGYCSTSCQEGLASRFRTVKRPATDGGAACTGATRMDAICDHGSCPVICAFGAWSSWGPCSKSCGNGTSVRTRRQEATGGGVCHKEESQNNFCNEIPCPQGVAASSKLTANGSAAVAATSAPANETPVAARFANSSEPQPVVKTEPGSGSGSVSAPPFVANPEPFTRAVANNSNSSQQLNPAQEAVKEAVDNVINAMMNQSTSSAEAVNLTKAVFDNVSEKVVGNLTLLVSDPVNFVQSVLAKAALTSVIAAIAKVPESYVEVIPWSELLQGRSLAQSFAQTVTEAGNASNATPITEANREAETAATASTGASANVVATTVTTTVFAAAPEGNVVAWFIVQPPVADIAESGAAAVSIRSYIMEKSKDPNLMTLMTEQELSRQGVVVSCSAIRLSSLIVPALAVASTAPLGYARHGWASPQSPEYPSQTELMTPAPTAAPVTVQAAVASGKVEKPTDWESQKAVQSAQITPTPTAAPTTRSPALRTTWGGCSAFVVSALSFLHVAY